MSAVNNWMPNNLKITYGRARYEIILGDEVGLKWLTYADSFLKEYAEETGHKYFVSPY